MQDTSNPIRSSIETVVGTGLFLTPWWSQFLTDVSLLASTIAQVTGAVVGIYGVLSIIKTINSTGSLRKWRERRAEQPRL